MGQKHSSYSLSRAKVTRQSVQMIQDEVASTVSTVPTRPSEPVPLGLRNSLDSSDYVRREVERQAQRDKAEPKSEDQAKVERAGIVPKSQENHLEGQAVAEPNEDAPKSQKETPKDEAFEHVGNVMMKSQEMTALECQTEAESADSNVPECLENAHEGLIEPKTDANDGLKSLHENALEGKSEDRPTGEVVQDVRAVNGLFDYVSGTKEVLLEVQAVGLLIHENEEHPADQTVEEVTKTQENAVEDKTCDQQTAEDVQKSQVDHDVIESSVKESSKVEMNTSNASEEEELISPTKEELQISPKTEEVITPTNEHLLISPETEEEVITPTKGELPIGLETEEEMITPTKEELPISLKTEKLINLANEELISQAKEEKTNQEEPITSTNEDLIVPAKEQQVLSQAQQQITEEAQQLQKVALNVIANSEEGQQQQVVTELSVDEQLNESPANDKETTAMLALDKDGNEQLRVPSPTDSKDVNVNEVAINNRKPSNV